MPRKLSIVLYTRSGCHLCDGAEQMLREIIGTDRMDLTLVDVDSDADLVAKFGAWVPVIEIDGIIRFRGQVSAVLLRRLL